MSATSQGVKLLKNRQKTKTNQKSQLHFDFANGANMRSGGIERSFPPWKRRSYKKRPYKGRQL